MTALAGVGRWATYRNRPSWFDLHPLPQGWRASERSERVPSAVERVPGRPEWQWVVTDGRGRVLAWGTVGCDLSDPQGVAREALERYLAVRGTPAQGLLCAARLAADPTVIGVVDGR